MQPYEYATMYRHEDHYWWYTGLRRLLALTFKDLTQPVPRVVLDAGCGTGGNLAYLVKTLSRAKVFAMDLHPAALDFTNSRKIETVLLQASINQVPFQANVFDVITCLDVACTRGVNDLNAFKEFYCVLKPGGVLLINLPAYRFLRGEHDVAGHVQHRYTARELGSKLKSAGFEIKRLTYWNALLFPFIFIWRRISAWKKNSNEPKSDFYRLPTWVNGMLKFILRIETVFLSCFNLPFGTSVLAVAEKPALDRLSRN